MQKKIFTFLQANRTQVLLMVVGVIISMMIWILTSFNSSGYALLYASLSDKDSYEITSFLTKSNIKYKIDGTKILVEKEDLYSARLKIAGADVMPNHSVGLEYFENSNSLTASSFSNNINYQKAMQVELERTIEYMPEVRKARVHLVIPKMNAFTKSGKQAKASVMLKIYGGRRLSYETVSAIQNLIAGSVRNLSKNNVSVVDFKGRLLSKTKDNNNIEKSKGLLNLQQKYEKNMEHKIIDLLEGVVGVGNVRAKVSVKLNRKNSRETVKTYDPEQRILISSKKITDTSKNGNTNGGAAGVNSNIPGNTNNAQSTQNNNLSSHVEDINNYEIGQTLATNEFAAGKIEKLTVAVIVGGKYSKSSDGKKVFQAQSIDMIDKIKTLVENTVGYDVERGDSVEVDSMEIFSNLAEANTGMNAEKNMQAETSGFMPVQDIAKYSILLISILLLGFFILKPLGEKILKSAVNKEEKEEDFEYNLAEEDKYLTNVKNAISQEPERTEKVVMEWLNDETE